MARNENARLFFYIIVCHMRCDTEQDTINDGVLYILM